MSATPDAAPSREAQARAVLEKQTRRGASEAVKKRAEKIRKHRKENGPRSALAEMQQRRTLDSKKMSTRIDANIGTKIDPSTGKKDRAAGTAEADRFKKANDAAVLAREFVENGYDKIVDPDGSKKAGIRTALSDALELWPEGKMILDGVSRSVDAKNQFLDGILKDPRMAETVGKVLEGKMSGEALIDKVTKAEVDEKAEKDKLDIKTGEKGRIATELSAINGKLAAFDGPATGGTLGGASFEDLKGLRETYSSDKATLATVDQQLNQISNRMNSLVSSRRADISESLSTMQGEITTLTEKAQTLRERISKKDDLEKQEHQLRTQKDALEQKQVGVNVEEAQLTRDHLLAKTELAQLKNEREVGEEEFAKGLEGVMKEASLDYLQDRIQEAEEADNAVIEEEIANAKTKQERDVLNGVLNRWDKDKEVWTLRGKKTIKVFNNKQIKEDFSDLLASGPEEVIKKMLSRGRTPEQVDEIMKDKEFVADMQDQVVERLVTRKIQTGKMNEDEGRRIFESEWGKGMIARALANNEGMAEEFKKMREAGAMHGSVAEFLSTRSKWEIGGILAAIFGTGLMGAGGILGGVGAGAALLGHGAGWTTVGAGAGISTVGAGVVGGAGYSAAQEYVNE